MQTHRYKAFGIIFDSEIEFSELEPIASESFDVRIRIGAVPKRIPESKGSGLLFEAFFDDFLFSLDTIGTFRVQNGNLITVQPNIDVNNDSLKVFIYGSIMGALLLQRGLIPFHGSAIRTDSGAAIFSGNSSSGKSSLAAEFSRRGFSLLTDDIAAISKYKNHGYEIFPGFPHIKLWKDILTYLNVDRSLKKVRPEIEKYYLPIQSLNIDEPLIVNKVFILVAKNTPEFSSTIVTGSEKFSTLLNNIYRGQYIDGLGLNQEIFIGLSDFAKTADVRIIERPSNPINITELADYIEDLM